MDYLKSLDISELIEFLEIEPRPEFFKMVEKILSTREKNMIIRLDNLEKNLKLSDSKCCEVSLELEEKNKTSVEMDIKIEEFKDYKGICHTLEEKVTRLEQLSMSRDEELIQIKTENIDLKSERRNIQAQKERLKELEKMMEHIIDLEKQLEMHKTSCLELSTALEEEKKKSIALEGQLVEFEGCKKICEVLKVKVAHLEENCKNVSESDKKAIRYLTSLLVDVEKFLCSKNNELVALETKEKYLECVEQRSYDKIGVQKKRCIELLEVVEHTEKIMELCKGGCSKLFTALGEEGRKSIAVAGNIEELNRFKINCEDLKEKVIRLEEDCRNVSEKEKNVKQIIIKLSADLENFTRSKNEQLSKFKAKIKDLEILKQKSDDEVEIQKNRYNKLERMVKNKADFEKDMEMCREKCSELEMAIQSMKKKSKALESKLESNRKLKEKVTRLEKECKRIGEREKMAAQHLSKLIDDPGKLRRIRGEEPIELKTKNKVLERAKRKVEDEITSRKKRYGSQVSTKDNMDVGTDVSNKRSNKDESKRIKSEKNGGFNHTSLSKLKTLSHKCGIKDLDSSGSASNRHSTVKINGGEQVGGPATSSLKSPSTIEEGELRNPEPTGSLFS